MSVITQINRIKANIAGAYTKILSLGGTASGTQDSDHLVSTLNTLVSSMGCSAAANTMLNNATAIVNNQLVTGNIPSKVATTYYPSENDQTISALQYLSGDQVIKKVITQNIETNNIKRGVTIYVGDEIDETRITAITGSLASIEEVSSIPLTYTSDIIHNTTNDLYYIWRT